MSNSKKSIIQKPGSSSWRTVAHLIAFGLLLALGMILVRETPGESDNSSRVVFTEADVAQVRAKFMRTWNRPPTAVELRKGLEQYVRDEILYREALARNLDRADPTVRLAMVRKITMMGVAQAEAAELTDEDIQAYFALRKERYRIPARVDMVQVYLNKDKRGENIQAEAEQLLDSLRKREPQPEQLAHFGDVSMLRNIYADMSEQDLDRVFGGDFGSTVVAVAPGQWHGPIESGYGLHLVKVTVREESRIPDITEVIQRVITDMRYEGRQAAEDQFYAEIVPRYQVLYDEAALAAIEGNEQ